jgi:hypothetical protein
MKLVKALPDANVNVYIDNVDMLEALLKVSDVFVDKNIINKMLKAEDMEETKKSEWRLCAIIVIKLCIAHKVPILTDSEYGQLRDRPGTKYDYYYKHIKSYMKFIFDAAGESGKKHRIAANGMLGEFLNFIFCSTEISNEDKKDHCDTVSRFLHGFTDKKSNRATKERFSLALEKIAARFPQIFAD